MRRKVLQDIANTVCQITVGWRFAEDYEKVAQLPDGTLDVDLLTEQTSHSDGSAPTLRITAEVSAWLRHRLLVHGIPLEALRSARLSVTHTADRSSADKRRIPSLDFSCRSFIETAEGRYVGVLVKKHAGHR